MSKELTICLLDMDGVLADWVSGICKLHNRPNPYANGQNRGRWDIEEIWGISEKELWAPVDEDFWALLDPLPMAEELVNFLEEEFEGEIGILSSPRLKVEEEVHKGCVDGKILWLNEHFPHLVDSSIFSHKKHYSAAPDTLLIDDNDKNVKAFQKRGKAYLVPRPWNSAHEEEFDLDDLMYFIDDINYRMAFPNRIIECR